MFVLSDSNAKRAYGTLRGFQLRADNAASSADACSSVSLQVWMVSGFTWKKLTAKERKEHKDFANHNDAAKINKSMSIQPFVTMTKKQVEEILAKESPSGRERILKMLEHSCSMYDFAGKHLPHPYEKENLLEVIQKRDTYVVDTNSEWKKECKNHSDKAFIITPALSREQENTKDLILDEARCKLGNIFSVGIIPKPGYVLVDRIDSHFQYCFDDAKLAQASKGKGSIVANQKIVHRQQIEYEKEQIRFQVGLELLFSVNSAQHSVSKAFWNTGKAEDLPSPAQMQFATTKLKDDIRRKVLECKYNINKSKTVVEMCHRTLLLEDERIRSEFDDPKKENVFGDMYILHGAIYLGANIMTKDIRLTKMAGYAGLRCFHVPQT
jgi:hypothetical protein